MLTHSIAYLKRAICVRILAFKKEKMTPSVFFFSLKLSESTTDVWIVYTQ